MREEIKTALFCRLFPFIQVFFYFSKINFPSNLFPFSHSLFIFNLLFIFISYLIFLSICSKWTKASNERNDFSLYSALSTSFSSFPFFHFSLVHINSLARKHSPQQTNTRYAMKQEPKIG